MHQGILLTIPTFIKMQKGTMVVSKERPNRWGVLWALFLTRWSPFRSYHQFQKNKLRAFDSFFLHLHTFFCHPHTKCKNIVFSFFVTPPYIIRKLFLNLEVFLRFIKSRTLFCIWNKPMDYVIRIYSGLHNPEVNLIFWKDFRIM